MRVETDEPEIVERIAALDVGKAEVVCCVRVPGPGAQRSITMRPAAATPKTAGKTGVSLKSRWPLSGSAVPG